MTTVLVEQIDIKHLDAQGVKYSLVKEVSGFPKIELDTNPTNMISFISAMKNAMKEEIFTLQKSFV